MTSKEPFPLASKYYIPFERILYTFWRKGIYVFEVSDILVSKCFYLDDYFMV